MAEFPAFEVENLKPMLMNSFLVSSTAEEAAVAVSAKHESAALVAAPKFAQTVPLAIKVPEEPTVEVATSVQSIVNWPLVRVFAWLVVVIEQPAGATTVPEAQPEVWQIINSTFSSDAAAST